MLKDGFYTALGTPVDGSGNVIEKSLIKQITDQIEVGTSGLLLMGSMGMEPCIKESEYGRIVKIAADAVNERCPLFVGAMDNSVWRVKEKLSVIENMKIEGIVITTPYYFVSPEKDVKIYFKGIAEQSRYPIYLYDLPGVTQIRITLDLVLSLIDDKRFAGIKSGNILLNKNLMSRADIRDDFSVLFSTLDLFDVAYMYGITKNLDGMFSCTPKNAFRAYQEFAKGDFETGFRYLNNIISLRDLFINYGVFPSFTVAMNILGYEGCFNPDYMGRVGEEAKDRIAEKMKEIEEI